MLSRIKNYFGVGIIKKHGETTLQYSVTSSKDLNIIISHFDKYSLHTQKKADYILFNKAYSLILNKEHLTVEGLQKIVAIKASLNLGLSDILKTAFVRPETGVISVDRPLVTNQKIKDPN